MAIEPGGPSRQSRSAVIRQADIARAIRGATQAGMVVAEVIATKGSVRILAATAGPSPSGNSWDEVLDDG